MSGQPNLPLQSPDATAVPAAAYVRMSTEHQQYSTENQADRIRDYAKHNNIDIVRTYADEGKSGLNIGGREGLQNLIADVRAKETDFELILVYDVSRWGRFQDADESADTPHRRQARALRHRSRPHPDAIRRSSPPLHADGCIR